MGERLLFESVLTCIVSSLNSSTACAASTSLSHGVVCVGGSGVVAVDGDGSGGSTCSDGRGVVSRGGGIMVVVVVVVWKG